jgi:(2Fe-2S) ferredoxin
MFLGNPGYLPRDIARYRAVTPEAVQAFAKKWLPDDRRIEMEIVPAGGGRKEERASPATGGGQRPEQTKEASR